ncbi:MAG: NAD(+) synthase [Clostridia bacterium]|nr:NAD(+) synthase [Clostridia bacterium]
MKEYRFDAEKVRDSLVAAIRDISARQGFEKVVIGISGGKDSTVTAALCARALGGDNVYGVMLPDGVQKDISDSVRVCNALGIRRRTVNIGGIHDALKSITDQREAACGEGEFAIPFSRESDINVGPRLRMTVLRYIAQSLGARLAGTGNLSEATVGYCTKDGDTSCDFSVLGSLTSLEVVEVGLTMSELPRDLVVKTPTDGLSGMSDEEKLGLSYRDIHLLLREGSCGNPETDEKIRRREKANMHKRRMPVILDPFGT